MLSLRRKIFLLVLAFCIAFPVFFTETMVIAEFDHDCTAEKENVCTKEIPICRPCLKIEAAINFLKTLRPGVVFSPSVTPLPITLQTSEPHFRVTFYHISSVNMKVRFNT